MIAKGTHKPHITNMEKMHGDKVNVWKPYQTIDDENLEVMIDTLSGSKQVKVTVKKK